MGDYQCADQDGTVMAKFVRENLKPGKLGKVDFELCAWETGNWGFWRLWLWCLLLLKGGRSRIGRIGSGLLIIEGDGRRLEVLQL